MDIKTIVFEPAKTKPDKKEKQTHKRVITQDKRWSYISDDFEHDAQLKLAISALDSVSNGRVIECNKIRLVVRMLSDKLRGYRMQDLSKTTVSSKSLYSETEFIRLQQVIELLLRSNMMCFYCKDPVKIIYDEVRDPKQWTLERIDNERGHNYDNVEIACLSCNVRRRTMYHERYVLTKQMCKIIKSEEQN